MANNNINVTPMGETMAELGGISPEEGQLVAEAYLRHGIARYNKRVGGFRVEHGALLDRETIQEALLRIRATGDIVQVMP